MQGYLNYFLRNNYFLLTSLAALFKGNTNFFFPRTHEKDGGPNLPKIRW